ncbi:hypothetical protein EU528_05190 [Candidatus Thorarchaeota archaeon]|nr:MAG: hypothetical protein EU528_05190 [Candidatus Thorarchaeota archaeon]
MSSRTVRSFPRTKNKPKKRWLLVPILLMFVGYLMTFVPLLMFWGAIISLTGALVIFLVGTVYADLWAAHRRTQQMIKDRDERFAEEELPDIEDPVSEDPFEETYEDE